MSKLLLLFTAIAVLTYLYIDNTVVVITAPETVAPNTIFKVTSTKHGKWLVRGAQFIELGKDIVINSPSSGEIEVIFSPGLIVKTIKVKKGAVTSEFTSLVHSWAPKDGREAVASALYSLGVGFTGEEIDDFIRLTRLNNQVLIKDNWKQFFQELGKYCEENMKEASLEEHKQLWIKIAASLREEAS